MDAAAVIDRISELFSPVQTQSSDEVAVASILSELDMVQLLECLHACNEQAQLHRLCTYIERISDTRLGAAKLAEAVAFVEGGVTSNDPRVRLLTARLLGATASLVANSETCQPLIALLRDDDYDVGAAAVRSLLRLQHEVLLQPRALPSAANDSSTVVRLRAMDVAARLASKSEAARAAVQASGVFHGLIRDVSNRDDALVALASCEVLAELVESLETAAGIAAVLSEALPALARLVRDDSTETLLRQRCLIVLGRIASSAQGVVALFLELSLYCMSQHKGLQEAAMQACGCLSESVHGAESMLLAPRLASAVCEAALRRPGSDAAVLAAMHTLATAAGAERPVDAELFSDEAERALEDACRQATTNLAAPLWAHLQRQGDAFVEGRIAAYRLMSALGRRRWAAANVCSHAALLAHLCCTEIGHRANTWRIAAVGALISGLRHVTDVQATLLSRLEAATRIAQQRSAEPQVATL
jgi:Proteasome non-ATPase 26S subunit